MPSLKIGSNLSPLLDPSTGRTVGARVWGTCDCVLPPDADASLEGAITARLVQATNEVLARRLASRELAISDLPQGLAKYLPEIIETSKLSAERVHVGTLSLVLSLDSPPTTASPAPAPAPAPASTPHQVPGTHRVDVKLKVGGLTLHADSEKGIDGAGLKRQLINEGKSQLAWTAAFGAIGCVAVLFIAALVIYVYQSAKSGTPAEQEAAKAASQWDGKSPFACSGNQKIVIKGVTSNLKVPPISAGGNCVLELDDVHLTAPVAIEATLNAVVTVKGGTIDASELAVDATLNAQVAFIGTKVNGKKKASGNAKVTGP